MNLPIVVVMTCLPLPLLFDTNLPILAVATNLPLPLLLFVMTCLPLPLLLIATRLPLPLLLVATHLPLPLLLLIMTHLLLPLLLLVTTHLLLPILLLILTPLLLPLLLVITNHLPLTLLSPLQLFAISSTFSSESFSSFPHKLEPLPYNFSTKHHDAKNYFSSTQPMHDTRRGAIGSHDDHDNFDGGFYLFTTLRQPTDNRQTFLQCEGVD